MTSKQENTLRELSTKLNEARAQIHIWTETEKKIMAELNAYRVAVTEGDDDDDGKS